MAVKRIFKTKDKIQLEDLSPFELFELFSKENNWEALAKVNWPKEKKGEKGFLSIKS